MTFHDDKPLEPWCVWGGQRASTSPLLTTTQSYRVLGSKWSDYNTKPNISTRELFAALKSPPLQLKFHYASASNVTAMPGPHHYFSANLKLIAPFWPSIEQETSPYLDEFVEGGAEDEPKRNLWLGRAGLVTPHAPRHVVQRLYANLRLQALYPAAASVASVLVSSRTSPFRPQPAGSDCS